jgi:hypothetical protein
VAYIRHLGWSRLLWVAIVASWHHELRFQCRRFPRRCKSGKDNVGAVSRSTQGIYRHFWRVSPSTPERMRPSLNFVRLQQLVNITDSLDAFLPSQSLTNEHISNLQTAKSECLDILNEMNTLISKNSELDSASSGFRDRSRRFWQRLKWDSGEVQKLRLQLTSNISLLNAIYADLSR